MDLIPTLSGRPPILTIDATTIYLSVHDRTFLAEAERLFREMCASHPDASIVVPGRRRSRGTVSFGHAERRLGAFLAHERDGFYRKVGYAPPRWDRWQRWCAIEQAPGHRDIPPRRPQLTAYEARATSGERGALGPSPQKRPHVARERP